MPADTRTNSPDDDKEKKKQQNYDQKQIIL